GPQARRIADGGSRASPSDRSAQPTCMCGILVDRRLVIASRNRWGFDSTQLHRRVTRDAYYESRPRSASVRCDDRYTASCTLSGTRSQYAAQLPRWRDRDDTCRATPGDRELRVAIGRTRRRVEASDMLWLSQIATAGGVIQEPAMLKLTRLE